MVPNDSGHRWRPLRDSRIPKRRGGAAIRWSAWFGAYSLNGSPHLTNSRIRDWKPSERCVNGAGKSLNKLTLSPRATRQLARSDLDLKQAVTSCCALQVDVVAGSVHQNELKSIERLGRRIQMREGIAQAIDATTGANKCLRHLTIRAHGCNGDLHVLTPNAKVSDGGQPPTASASPPGVPAGYRSLDRLVRLPVESM